MLTGEINKAKDIAALSWWWVAIPFYFLLTVISKIIMVRGTNLFDELDSLFEKNPREMFISFLVLPVAAILVNSVTLKKAWFYSSYPTRLNFLNPVKSNFTIITLSFTAAIVYLVIKIISR